ncbi:MAG: bifunctional hydroxymethylpyrimidine kinase/phosphomethylpyrimidine kinase [Myxococcota bacterium]
MRSALAIAGSDPTGGAGLQLDLQVFALHGVHGMAVPTALTVQTTTGLARSLPVFPNVVGEQLTALLDDIRPDALKIGMLATDDVLLRVAGVLERFDIPRIVDPVMRASDGSFLLERRALQNLAERLVRGATLVTPNRDEAEVLTGTADPEQAARALLEQGARAALIKGGHAEGPPDDFLLTTPHGEGSWIRGERVETGPVHGTGCALSSAIAARIARGESLADAVRGAKRWLEKAIAAAEPLGKGQLHLHLGPG